MEKNLLGENLKGRSADELWKIIYQSGDRAKAADVLAKNEYMGYPLNLPEDTQAKYSRVRDSARRVHTTAQRVLVRKHIDYPFLVLSQAVQRLGRNQ
jgi:hypothetical protein